MAHFDSVLRADFYAGVALPALLGLLIEGLHCMAGLGAVLVKQHQIVRADIHARGFVLAFTAIAFFCANEGGHNSLQLRKYN
jgi:hypothetical protein